PRLRCCISHKHASRDTASKQTCSSATRCLGDRPVKHPGLAAFLRSVRDARRKDCRLGCANADARNSSIPPCCPAFGRETRVAGRKKRRGETNRRCVAPGFAMRVQALMKPKPDELAHQYARRGTC